MLDNTKCTMRRQTTQTLLMIEPVAFYHNAETAVNNYYQEETQASAEEIQTKALKEFNLFVEKLRAKGVQIITIKDTLSPHTPDSIFPNNWNSTHIDGTLVLYPMFAENRREERRDDIVEALRNEGFRLNKIISYAPEETHEVFLEGTGSIILDRVNRLAYAAISPRTDADIFVDFCNDMLYQPIMFRAYQNVGDQRLPIYHTNVMMCVADEYAVICLDAIDNAEERMYVVDYLKSTGKEIIEINEEQTQNFAGNMLQIHNDQAERFLVMSTRAYKSLNEEQRTKIEKYNPVIHSDLTTIEQLGGGSARCMMAEIFLPKE